MTRRARILALAVSVVLAWSASSAPARRVEIVATGVPRPLQLALDRAGALVILSPGAAGDSAAEIFRVTLEGPFPVDLARAPRVRIPFAAGPRKAALGSLAIDPESGALFLGEENGKKLQKMAAEGYLSTESNIFAFSPKMSYAPKAWVDADTDFWAPKPKAAAKAAAAEGAAKPAAPAKKEAAKAPKKQQ